MPNTHSIPDTYYENQAVWGDLGPQVIVAHTGLTVPASSLTLAAVSASGYVLATGPPARLVYVSQSAVSVTLSATNGNWWLAVHADLHTPVSGWTRRSGSHFLVQQAATQPANPSGGLVFAQLTVASLIISAVTPLTTVTSQPMSQQNSNAVAITGGTAVLSGVSVPTSSGSNLSAFYTNLAAAGGSNRYALRCEGDAPALLGGALQVNGNTTMLSNLGLGVAAQAGERVYLRYARASTHGMTIHPSDQDTGANAAINFINQGGSTCGSITTTATATAYNTSSDVRLKFDVQALSGALERVRALRPVAFKWQADDSPGVGYLAHELMQIVPEAVTGLPDAVVTIL